MNELITEAADLQKFIQDNGFEFYFIGGVAVQVWGEPRLTQDIDVTVFTNLRDEPAFINLFLQKYRPKFSEAAQFALMNRVLPMQTAGGIGIDLLLGGLSDLNEAHDRSSYEKLTDKVSLRLCSAEDLIIMKTVAARFRDWGDIESVIIKQEKLDWEYIEKSIESLRDYEDITDKLATLLNLRNRFYPK